MARRIDKYVSEDGSEWDTCALAEKRDALLEQVAKVMSPLGKEPTDKHCKWANGNGYLQHDPATVMSVKAALVKLSRPYGFGWFEEQEKKADFVGWGVAHPSYMCRILEGSAPLDRAWSRLWCIDKLGREFGQPYFASHPSEAKLFEIRR